MNHLELTRPFEARKIKWRLGATNGDKTKGIALAYIDARDVMQRLDSVVGPAKWQTTLTSINAGTNVCELSLNIDGAWIKKSDGAGMTQVEGEKGGISDALKRSAVNWGIGRYLYYLDNTWYPIKPAGRSYKLAETPKLPSWALPESWEKVYPEMFGSKSTMTPAEVPEDEQQPGPKDNPLFDQASQLLVDKQKSLSQVQKDWCSAQIAANNPELVIEKLKDL